nr:3D domain-containing protein [uncultured Lachnoclostridium sp.]
MMSTKFKRMLRAGVVAGCVAAMGCTGTLVYAEPSTEELEEQKGALENEVSSLNEELNSLSSDIEQLSTKMEETAAAMEETQKQMDEAQKKGEEQYEAMKLRIKYMYEAGDTTFLELLCSAEDMADFLNKTDFVQNVSEYDRDMLQELEDTQNEIKKQGDALKEQQTSLADMEEELNAKQAELQQQISDKSDQISEYSSQIEKAKEAEALLAQQRAAAQAAAQQPSGSGSSGSSSSGGGSISTDGKQSLGRFRITHYCPCFYCTGSWGGSSTASGTVPTAGRTIAVDPSVIPLGSQVIINGHVYTAEDTGGAINGNVIDIFVNDHATALACGVYYAEVYWAN